ncbi:MAG: hypothetical protein IJP98_02350 [Clostridia bacterium]|nr:hypothetical protein [Clostridia bacterium]
MENEALIAVLEVLYRILVAFIVLGVLGVLAALMVMYIPRTEKLAAKDETIRQLRELLTENSKKRTDDQYERNELVNALTEKQLNEEAEWKQRLEDEQKKTRTAEGSAKKQREIADTMATLLDQYVQKYGVMRGKEDQILQLLNEREAVA